MINKYFDNTYLINLDRRADRLEKANLLKGKYNFEFERFQAIDGLLFEGEFENNTNLRYNKFASALNKTIIKILEDAIIKKYSSILICEDDIEFNSGYLNILNKGIIKFPENWDLFYFGCTHIRPFKFLTNNIGIIREANACHSVGINSKNFKLLIDELKKDDKPFDLILREVLQKKNNSFCIFPNVTYQYSGISDIEGGFLDAEKITK
jgi:GR25 family glycosyltransferase involved in LPS biosynthesis